MLAVVVSPHRFTTALTSEASIVPGASYRRITPTACPGRVLGAASQVRSCFVQLSQPVLQLRVAPPSPNPTAPRIDGVFLLGKDGKQHVFLRQETPEEANFYTRVMMCEWLILPFRDMKMGY